jgi:hypothetical protein
LDKHDLAWRIGVAIGVIAGVVQILLGGPARPTRDARSVLAAG